MSITKKIPLGVSLYIILLPEKHKPPICVVRKKYSVTKNCPIAVSSTIFVTGILITTENLNT